MSNHPQLHPDSFPAFFQSLHRRAPFRWQARLAERACQGDWPRFVKLPTSSGKTSCLDIAVFALAHQAWRRYADGTAIDAPRRIFFVVDRRIIVNEAFNRASSLKAQLHDAIEEPRSPLFPVAWWLRSLAGNTAAPPLDCFELRGGIYRDDAWVRSLLQPTIVTSTVDQVGSRLLFRGYGVSDRNLPIHAALTANDSLIMLDEAHCSKPFSQTMESIARYRDAYLAPTEAPRWAEQPIKTPFRFIEMTATPRDVSGNAVFQLEEGDYQVDQPLEERHGCVKPIRLVESKAKGVRQNAQLANDLVAQAEIIATGSDSEPICLRVAIVVNRVECARQAFQLLKEKYGDRVDLMIGRMRPIDRDRLTGKLQLRFKCESDEQLTQPYFVVATQCLEVGADFDFDGLVCQCASLDSLRQRFGRLNRLGKSTRARGVIVMAEGDRTPRTPDPIYGESLPATWEWLGQQATDGVIDFGIRSIDARLVEARREIASGVDRLAAPSLDAPVLMPAHLDLLCQTAPRPAVEPDIPPYLHGPNRGMPEVSICWRADLPENSGDRSRSKWLDECYQTLAVCPPSSAECLSVPLPQFNAWLQGKDGDQSVDFGDVLGEASEGGDAEAAKSRAKSKPVPHRRGIVWNGRECRAVSGVDGELDAVFPNSVVVLPATAGGWSQLGYVPDAPGEVFTQGGGGKHAKLTAGDRQSLARIDVASAAYAIARDRYILRVHDNLITDTEDWLSLDGLWDFLSDLNRAWQHRELFISDEGFKDFREIENPIMDVSQPNRSAELRRVREALAKQPAKLVTMIRYPSGFAVIGHRNSKRPELPRASFDDDFDEHNLDADKRLSLIDHLADVTAEMKRLVENVCLEAALASALVAAAERHDLGKADPRFQAMLLGSSLDMAYMQPRLWAKSARGTGSSRIDLSNESRSIGCEADKIPNGFRHEMLSLDFARQLHHDLDPSVVDVMLHAIAAHHGHARPFAPVVNDDAPLAVSLDKLLPNSSPGLQLTLSTEKRLACPVHRLDSGVSERFWKVNRRFGWWGLAWLESALRLADWVASAQPSRLALKYPEFSALDYRSNVSSHAPSMLNSPGLNGASSLGFLAALGLFRHIAKQLDSSVRLKWEIAGGNWSPTFFSTHPILGDAEAFLDWLHGSLSACADNHWLKRLNEYSEEQLGLTRPSAYSKAIIEASWADRSATDWLSCNGSDLCDPSSNNQLQTARRDYFPKSATAIVQALTREHLKRSLFRQWDYADPIHQVSLHLEPREDRRHAYQWHKPMGDPTRALHGGMVGANRLAMEAWPLFQSVPVRGDLQTLGFHGTRPMKGIRWTWPVWSVPLALCDVTAVLNFEELQNDSVNSDMASWESLLARGIATAFRLRRILVEKTPNFTAPVALFTGALAQTRHQIPTEPS